MARDRQKPDDVAIIANHERRIALLETQIGRLIDERKLPTPFSFDGTFPPSTESPKWRPVHSVEVTLMVPELLVAPSGGDLTIAMTLYGPSLTGVVRTLTVPDGSLYVEDAVPFIIPAGGSLTATTGSDTHGAASLSIAILAELL